MQARYEVRHGRLMRRLGIILAVWLAAAGGMMPAPLISPAVAQEPSMPAPASVPPDMMGIVIRDPWFDFDTNPAFPGQSNKTFQDRMGAVLAQMGVRWVRLDFRIAAPLDADPRLPPDFIEREIARNDYFINEVAPRYGFKVLGLLSFDLIQGTDAHVLNTGPFTETSIYGGGVNRYMDEWLTRALMIADRYGERVAAYQVLNEQNRLPQYLPGGPAGDGIEPVIVARMVTKLYRFCRGIPPLPRPERYGCATAAIILGGLHPRGATDGWSDQTILTDADYLKQIYASEPFQGFRDANSRWPIDGIGYHPYPEEIRLSPNDALVDRGLNRMRAALVEAGDPNVPFWITEIGYNVGFDVDGPRGPMPPQTEAGQAAFLHDVYVSLAARGDVARIFWFKYEDFPPADGPNAQRWGLVRIPFRAPQPGENCPGGACYAVDGEPERWRPAYLIYREIAGLPVYRQHFPIMAR
ncbi:conserved hypothetical protein [Roseiflexus castenholzii DSM 13941]|uniref:Asl1-like glycosyl hydrolase catalytic domain-containing protein n=1 Tax=Roseiflexus castenholzii (strain DSM 13941 / HLO8) TaxID=383372 RepID=A7NJW6_ROSCS|nr:conserved hypothetical protein [Roseiflexus castenholzii DSM 13941]